MNIITKPFTMPIGSYVKVAFINAVKEQWYVTVIAVVLFGVSLYFHDTTCAVLCCVAETLYLMFWVAQFYGVSKLPQGKIMFQKLFYEFNESEILMHVDVMRAAKIEWSSIKKCKRYKNAYVIFLSKANVVYLLDSVFRSKMEFNLFETLLKRKKIM